MIHKPTGFQKSLTVVGIMEEPYYETSLQGGYIAITGPDEVVNDKDRVNAVLTIDLSTKEDCIGEIAYRIVVNPINLLLIVIFSVVAVWISAWIPALKISKIGPVESIRGNETSGKIRRKGYKSYLGLMLKGKAEKLMGTACVERNRTATKGIIRSITAFCTLTLITAFAAGSVTDIINSMTEEENLKPGPAYEGFTNLFTDNGYLEDDLYLSGREDIMKRLRKKLEQEGDEPVIQTVRGMGYRMV